MEDLYSGKSKDEIMDIWLDMDNDQLIQECKLLGTKHQDNHVDNIQILFKMLQDQD